MRYGISGRNKLAGIVAKPNDFLHQVTEHIYKATSRVPDRYLLIIAGIEFDARFKAELTKQSGKQVRSIDSYMSVEYEVKLGVPKDRMFVVDKRQYKSNKIIIARA